MGGFLYLAGEMQTSYYHWSLEIFCYLMRLVLVGFGSNAWPHEKIGEWCSYNLPLDTGSQWGMCMFPCGDDGHINVYVNE